MVGLCQWHSGERLDDSRHLSATREYSDRTAIGRRDRVRWRWGSHRGVAGTMSWIYRKPHHAERAIANMRRELVISRLLLRRGRTLPVGCGSALSRPFQRVGYPGNRPSMRRTEAA